MMKQMLRANYVNNVKILNLLGVNKAVKNVEGNIKEDVKKGTDAAKNVEGNIKEDVEKGNEDTRNISDKINMDSILKEKNLVIIDVKIIQKCYQFNR